MRTPLLALCLLLFIPVFAAASELHLVQSATSVRTGDVFAVDLFLDTGRDVINALEGSVTYPLELELREVRLGGSVVPLWIVRPEEKRVGTVSFAGVLPGGYQASPEASAMGSRGNVFTLVFHARMEGVARITFGSDTALYLDNGEGTRAELRTVPLAAPIRPADGPARDIALGTDTTPPSPFTPVTTARKPFGYDGAVLVFATEDKDSGLRGFELARSYSSSRSYTGLSWRAVESPYILTEDDADTFLFVRATDRAGNTYTAAVPPRIVSVQALLHRWWLLWMFSALFGVILCWKFAANRRIA